MTTDLNQTKQLPFLHDCGEMGEIILNYDWTRTSLGPIEDWPESLKINVSNIIYSAFPMFIFWGDDCLCFYNDAYRPSLGTDGRHPAIGKKAIGVWGDIWYVIGPLIQEVLMTRKPVFFEDQLVPFHRDGKFEDIYWTFTYSPCFGENNEVKGVLVTCVETTKFVKARNRNEISLS